MPRKASISFIKFLALWKAENAALIYVISKFALDTIRAVVKSVGIKRVDKVAGTQTK